MKTGIDQVVLTIIILLFTASCASINPTEQGSQDRVSSSEMDLTESASDFDVRIMTSSNSILQAINVRRAESAVPALISQPELADLAYRRSTDLAVRSYLDHKDPSTGEVELQSLLAERGYAGPAAELLYAAGDPLESVSQRVVEAWFNDPMHKALLLESSFRYCGIGIMGDGEWWNVTVILTAGLPEEVKP